MSHFSVLVISTRGIDDVDQQLAPYDENRQVKRYVCEEVSEEERINFLKFYVNREMILAGDPAFDFDSLNYEQRQVVHTESQMVEVDLKDFEAYYKKYGRDWNSMEWREQDGIWVRTSTYNPDSKWDWYEIGGRWAGKLPLKKEYLKEKALNFSWGWSDASKTIVENGVGTDQAKKYMLDWNRMKGDEKEKEELRREFLLLTRQIAPETPEEKENVKFEIMKPEYYFKMYSDENDYANQNCGFNTYAMLVDGEWFEPGKMGWWAMTDETSESKKEHHNTFWDKIESAPDDALFTVVDCHI